MINLDMLDGAEMPKAGVTIPIPLRKGVVARIAKNIITGLIIFSMYNVALI